MERMTTQRKTILGIILDRGHLTFNQLVEEILKVDNSISLSTLYRNVSSLREDGYIRSVHFDGKEEVYESTEITAHNHFLCDKCGNIIDIFDKKVKTRLEKEGNLVTSYSVTYHGTCKDCLSKEKN